VEHEIRIMKMMDHPNCVKLYEVSALPLAPHSDAHLEHANPSIHGLLLL
jgi:hypothetical protein